MNVDELRSKTVAARQRQASFEAEQARITKREERQKRRKYLATARKEAEQLVVSTVQKIQSAADRGDNYCCICKTESGGPSESDRDKIIRKRFEQEGFGVDIHFTKTGEEYWGPDYGWMDDGYYSIAVKW